MKSHDTGIKRIIKAFTYSASGFKSAFQSEAAFRQDILFCIIAFFILLIMPVKGTDFALMLFSLLFILWSELVNTAIETIIDRIGPLRHPLSKKAKDIGSLLVLISFINFFCIWGNILKSIY